MNEWLRCAFSPPVAARALRVAAVVGTILVLLNHGPALVTEGLSTMRAFQILLTYLVPFGVSTYSAVEATRQATPG